MKKKIFVLTMGILIIITVCNMYNVLGQVSSLGMFTRSLEAMAEGECSKYEGENEWLSPSIRYCAQHRENHEWKTCISSKGKCCDSREQSPKPICVGD